MFASPRWSHLLASTFAIAVASTCLADDVFVKEGVIVKPLPKYKQRQLERKMIRRPGNKVVIEGTPSSDASVEVKTRRAFRPLFGERFAARRGEVIATPFPAASSATAISRPSTTVTKGDVIVSTPRATTASGDPLVIPGSVELKHAARAARPPIVSTPRGAVPPVEPPAESGIDLESPASGRSLPQPAEEIPPPVVSTPRKAGSSPNPTPAPVPSPAPEVVPNLPAPVPSVDPGPAPTTPAPEPVSEPVLELPAPPRPA